MNKVMSAFKVWLNDPFGKKRIVKRSRFVLSQMTETKVEVRTAINKRQGYQAFPISNMVINNNKNARRE